MFSKPIYIALLILACSAAVFITPTYCAINCSVSPHDSNIYDDSAWDNANGNTRTISGVLPGDFKENEQENIGYGTFSNRVYCNSNSLRYTLKIRINGDLSSGTNTIPASSLRYLYTYAGNVTMTKEATGTKYNYRTYVPFSFADTNVYESGTDADETITSPTYKDWEHQFKYAIQVPNNQPAGTYTGTITYSMGEIGGSTLTKTCQISIDVGNYFRLSVDRGSGDFETMKPGAVKDNVPVEGIIITSKTNTGNPWYLKISNDNPLSSGPYVIPNSNLIWYGWTDGVGTWYGTGNNSITFAPELMYASGANERNNMPDGTNNHLKFKLTIPSGQPGGKYLSNIKLTMTE
jgi:hypothetical protein